MADGTDKADIHGWDTGISAAIVILFLLFLSCEQTSAQTFQFLPEVDAYYKIQSNLQFSFQAKETREAGNPTQGEIGPSFSFLLKPLVRLKNVTLFDLDDAKSPPLLLSIGYRYVPTVGKPATQRVEPAFTFHLPLTARFLLSDRNRADLDWSQGRFTWRYRNRPTLERRVTIRSYHPAPYVSSEFFYQSRYHKWSTTALYTGCLLPAGRHMEFNPYYEHQNITGPRPNHQLNQVGLVLNLYL